MIDLLVQTRYRITDGIVNFKLSERSECSIVQSISWDHTNNGSRASLTAALVDPDDIGDLAIWKITLVGLGRIIDLWNRLMLNSTYP
jgi:hypothetical protein